MTMECSATVARVGMIKLRWFHLIDNRYCGGRT